MKQNLNRARESRLGLDGYCRILRSIANRPATPGSLAERFGLYPRTMRWILASLHRAKLILSCDWQQEKPRG